MYQIYNRTYAEVMLSCIVYATDSSVTILCSFAMQNYKNFSRLSSLNFSIRVDMVLFTELYEGFL